MSILLGRIVILVEDYDDAFEFYEQNLGARKIVDYTVGPQRYLHIGFDEGGAGIWFLRSPGHTGRQTNGEPAMVMYTTEFETLKSRLEQNGVNISKPAVYTDEAWFLHFLDLYGNEIVLVEMRK
ncbi:VOC family protein [Chitinophaga caseinilytica]|uniref:VOC family protein n=1 Tax=Chitinophaga caseinilytica TaxID=2267521 RepID=A0ABZ2Z6E7_9BACT